MKQALHGVGLKAQVKKRKPLLLTKNINACLEFLKSHHHWTIEDWKWVIFLDETKINSFCLDRCSWCWASPSTNLNLQMMKLTIKHGEGSVMVWRCLTIIGSGLICKIDGRMNQFVYCEILESKLLGFYTKFDLNSARIIFQHNNDSKHTTKTIKEWLLNQPFSLMEWLLQSPDLKPMEHLWATFKLKLKRYPSVPKDLIEL